MRSYWLVLKSSVSMLTAVAAGCAFGGAAFGQQFAAHGVSSGLSCGVSCDQRAPAPLDAVRSADRMAIGAASRAGGHLRGSGGLEDGSIVDILVVYSTQARDAAGGVAEIELAIQAGLDELNTAATDSLVPTTFRVVRTEEVAHSETGSLSAQLRSLREPGDNVLDGVHAMRDAHKADLVMLVVSSGDVCGIANIGVGPGNTPTPQNAFSVVSLPCMTAPVSAFAHEIGHNMGLLHGYEENPCTNGSSRFAKGYNAPDESFNTVMGVGTGPRVLRFSNPLVGFGGQATGVAAGAADAADSAAALAMSAPVVARYRSRDLNENGVEDSAEILSGALSDCDGNGYPDFADQDFNRNGVPDACDIAAATSVDADGDGVPDEAEAARLYVDADAAGAGTGLSWADAMDDLQDALALARASGDVAEIWIAEGVYRPAAAGHRAVRFDLVGGVSLYGGFAGTETSLDQRIDGAHPTALSGDLNGDDTPDPRTPAGIASRQDNSINVVFLFEEDGLITLDGLTIEHGLADFEVNCGGFTDSGGGMVAFGGELAINNCVFRENAAVTSGALLVINDVRSRITNTRFLNNAAVDGLFYGTNYPTEGALPFDGWVGVGRINTFYNGVDNQFVGNLVMGNRDSEATPGLLIVGCEPLFANNVFADNLSTSTINGAALGLILCEGVEIVNSTFANNSAPNASGIRGNGIASNRSQVVISNCILFGNTSGTITDQRAQFSQSGAGVEVQFINSIVQGWTGSFPGVGTIDADPLFADAASGDFSILAGSPAIDAGDNTRVPVDALDLDADGDTAEPLSRDFAGEERFVDDPGTADTGVGFVGGGGPIVDAGAFEFQPTVSCAADVAAPFGVLDLTDITTFVAGFTSQNALGDFDGNGIYDLSDITGFVAAFLAGCP